MNTTLFAYILLTPKTRSPYLQGFPRFSSYSNSTLIFVHPPFLQDFIVPLILKPRSFSMVSICFFQIRLPNDYQSRYWLPQESYAIIWSISMLIQRLVIPDLLNDCSHIACQVSHRLINVLIKLLLLLCSNINIRCKISNRRIFFWIHSTFVSK